MKHRAKTKAWADPEVERVLDLLKQSSRIGWREALERIESEAPFFAHRMRNLSLGNWKLLLDPNPKQRVLDVGCGFGSLTLGSAVSSTQAVGLDVLPERVTYGQLRARQRDTENAHFVVGNGLKPPFRPNSFDLVTFNGVLEWAGLFASGRPGDLQRKMLSEAARLVGPSGMIAIAIENSLAAETLLGLRDTHTGTHWLTCLPEPFARILLRLRLGREPRVRLHSRWGYRRLMRRLGLPVVRILNLIPSYNNYRFAVSADDMESHKFIYRNFDVGEFYRPSGVFRAIAARTYPALIPNLAYAYLVIGARHRPAMLLDPQAAMWKALNVEPGLHRFAMQTKSPGSVGILFHDGEHATLFVACWTGKAIEPELPRHVADKHGSRLVAEQELEVSGVSARAFRIQ